MAVLAQIYGGSWQDASGNVLSGGSATFELSQDEANVVEFND